MLKAGLEKAGTPLDDSDQILAACALANDLVPVTNNVKHFERIEGLRLTNWAQESPWAAVLSDIYRDYRLYLDDIIEVIRRVPKTTHKQAAGKPDGETACLTMQDAPPKRESNFRRTRNLFSYHVPEVL